MDSDTAILYGVLLGDGCLSAVNNGRFLVITCNIHSDIPLIQKVLDIIQVKTGKRPKPKTRTKYGTIEINFSNKSLFREFVDMGFPIGRKGVSLDIPSTMKDNMIDVINGYFATDGCLTIVNNNRIRYPRIEFASISKRLLEQVRDYLSSQGIKGNIYLSKKYLYYNPLCRLQINGKKYLRLFSMKIGFLNPKHEQRYASII